MVVTWAVRVAVSVEVSVDVSVDVSAVVTGVVDVNDTKVAPMESTMASASAMMAS